MTITSLSSISFHPITTTTTTKTTNRTVTKPPAATGSNSKWWTPLFSNVSPDPDYITHNNNNNKPVTETSDPDNNNTTKSLRFAPGCFTEEKAKQLRIKTTEMSNFHDVMYHSAIASRLASDVSGR